MLLIITCLQVLARDQVKHCVKTISDGLLLLCKHSNLQTTEVARSLLGHWQALFRVPVLSNDWSMWVSFMAVACVTNTGPFVGKAILCKAHQHFDT